MTLDIKVLGGTVVTPEGRQSGVGVGIADGRIVAIGILDRLGPADRVVDASDRLVLPGIVDTHVHAREPGQEEREDFRTASRAAAAGGVTTFLAMPNTEPPIDSVDRLRETERLGASKSVVDFACYGYLGPGGLEEIPRLAEAGVVGFKSYLAISANDMATLDDGELLDAMAAVADTGRPLAVHAENADIVDRREAGARDAGRNRPIDHARSRPVVAETEAVSRLVTFARETGCRVSVVHTSSGSGAALIADAKSDGIDIRGETCPQYLWFEEEALEAKGNAARINPPLRPAQERERLWSAGIHGDGVDYLGTDHSPHRDAEKGADDYFQNTWTVNSGFVGLETEVPAMLTFVDEGRITLEQWIDLASRGPAKAWGLYPQKGSLRVGTDADLTIVDPDATWTLDKDRLQSKSTTTPWDGERFVGAVETTIVRGTVVYDDDSVVADPGYGQVVRVDGGRET
jgi:dihydroorotase/allantoinase